MNFGPYPFKFFQRLQYVNLKIGSFNHLKNIYQDRYIHLFWSSPNLSVVSMFSSESCRAQDDDLDWLDSLFQSPKLRSQNLFTKAGYNTVLPLIHVQPNTKSGVCFYPHVHPHSFTLLNVLQL